MNELLQTDTLTQTAYLLTLCLWVKDQHRIVPALQDATVRYNGRAQQLGWAQISYQTMRRKYYAWDKSKTELALVDKRRLGGQTRRARSSSPEFLAYLGMLATRHQRKKMGAILELYNNWAQCENIPGYIGCNPHPHMPLPAGWSMTNLLRKMPDKVVLSLHQRGMRASAGMLAQVHATRVGGYAAQVVMFDDVWLDLLVSGYDDQGRGALGRPLQIGALDQHTGKRLCWGTTLRVKRKDGSHTGLNADHMMLVLCQYLMTVGYSKRGTLLVMENGTATITKEQEQMLYDLTGGLVRVDRSGMSGGRQIAGQSGRQVGNPRHKASLESWHNLLHNRLDGYGLAVGHDRTEPEKLHGQKALVNRELKAIDNLSPERAALISSSAPTMAQLIDKLDVVVADINNRTDHQLEGWVECGYTVDEFSLSGTGQWVSAQELSPERLLLCRQLAELQPECYRRRAMSPAEAWEASLAVAGNELIRLSPTQAVMLLGVSTKVRLTAKGGVFRLASRRRYHEELLFETRVRRDDGYLVELPVAEYYGVFNPFAPEGLLILDAEDRVQGLAARVQRIAHADEESIKREWGRVAARNAEAIARAEMYSAPDEREREIRAGYNARVMAGYPVTPLEMADEQTLRAAPAPALAAVSLTPCEGLGADDDWSAPAAARVDRDAWGLPSVSGGGAFYAGEEGSHEW